MIFGASAFTIRLPALIGAAIYIAAAYFLVRLITPRLVLQWSLLVCLVYNPFVMDYLVAARGYSMALAFLTCAVTLAAWQRASGVSPHRTAALISVCAALSVSANFSFAIVERGDGGDRRAVDLAGPRRARAEDRSGRFVLPGLAVGYFFVGSVLLSWPKGQFSWGARSLLATGDGILRSCTLRAEPVSAESQAVRVCRALRAVALSAAGRLFSVEGGGVVPSTAGGQGRRVGDRLLPGPGPHAWLSPVSGFGLRNPRRQRPAPACTSHYCVSSPWSARSAVPSPSWLGRAFRFEPSRPCLR